MGARHWRCVGGGDGDGDGGGGGGGGDGDGGLGVCFGFLVSSPPLSPLSTSSHPPPLTPFTHLNPPSHTLTPLLTHPHPPHPQVGGAAHLSDDLTVDADLTVGGAVTLSETFLVQSDVDSNQTGVGAMVVKGGASVGRTLQVTILK